MNRQGLLVLALCVVTLGASSAVRAQGWGREGRDKDRRDDHRRPAHAAPVRHDVRRVDRDRPLAHHTEILRNRAFMDGIRGREHAEMAPGRYYWHSDHGVRYAHYYWHGSHWYGFYWGPRFYWTRYWGNRWWWYDGPFHRWVYFYNGFWWYTGPGGVVYYYNNGDFVPYQAAPAVVAGPPPVAHGRDKFSPDGTRFVQITGPRAEAYLYDRTTGSNTYVNYLGPNVESVRFAGGNGQPLQILVNYRDGSFGVFDAQGHNLQGANSAGAPNQPPTPAPSAPSAAPGAGGPTGAPPALEGAPPSADEQPPSAPPSGSDSSAPANGPADGPPSAPPQ